jgi:hypothetical protein
MYVSELPVILWHPSVTVRSLHMESSASPCSDGREAEWLVRGIGFLTCLSLVLNFRNWLIRRFAAVQENGNGCKNG